ncbi:uncharacterized protein LOC122279326 isoform X2 [Carya illinoinensis]|uniref:uncharacterized protein LOC122279326 isoform X2 n=1 Tax=Carya illinoinensis TaxID=32201 RepID=UPI001C71B8F9|nr:uncharacterized protein LOC122279326 isoform X2 [Carya illinoinensis]
MVKVSTYFAMSLGAFLFWESMDKLHVWIALHQDEKVFTGGSLRASAQFLDLCAIYCQKKILLCGLMIVS